MRIIEGFSGLAQAQSWDAKLDKIEEAIDSLWLQKAIYTLAFAAKSPGLAKMTIRRERGSHGVEISAFIMLEGLGEAAEIGSLMLARLIATGSECRMVQMGEADPLAALRTSMREVELWFKTRPGMVRGAEALGLDKALGVVKIVPGMEWGGVADALGAHAAKALMEQAQLEESSGDGSFSGAEHVKRL